MQSKCSYRSLFGKEVVPIACLKKGRIRAFRRLLRDPVDPSRAYLRWAEETPHKRAVGGRKRGPALIYFANTGRDPWEPKQGMLGEISVCPEWSQLGPCFGTTTTDPRVPLSKPPGSQVPWDLWGPYHFLLGMPFSSFLSQGTLSFSFRNF